VRDFDRRLIHRLLSKRCSVLRSSGRSVTSRSPTVIEIAAAESQ
jgi:hypothetical protein